MNIKHLTLILLTFIIAGCIDLKPFDLDLKIPVSLHPLYTDKETIFDQRLLGDWTSESEPNTIVRFENVCNHSYEILLIGQGHTAAAFEVHLLKLDNKSFLDISPATLDVNSYIIQNPLLLPTHMLMKIKAIDPNLQVQPLSITKELERDPNFLKHETSNPFLILTGSTKELQDFIKSHADDEELFSVTLVLERLRSGKTPDSNNADPNRP
ncbi:MAG: hypothetical protein ABSB91_06440 [Sedimentisphaerales bacterium]